MSAVAQLEELLAEIPDPEIPVLTLADLGILRGVTEDDEGRFVITVTPTYSGCPAIDPICDEVRRVAHEAGYDAVEVRTSLAPAWTTDWMSEEGKRKLLAYGIVPPERASHPPCALIERTVLCPRCGSSDTRETSAFGTTPCQAQHVCNACLEPFARFKAL